MHACIAALSQNIPAVAIAYSKKFYGMMQTIDMESFVADPKSMSKEDIFDILSQTYEQRKLLRKKLEQKIPRIKQTVLNLFSDKLIFS